MKQRVEEMEREANKLREMQAAAENAERGAAEGGDSSVPMETEEDKAAADSRSIFVGNVCSAFLFHFERCADTLAGRSTTLRRQKRFRCISSHVELSIE